MPKYYGSNQAVYTPFMQAPKTQHTPEQINGWWDALANGASADIQVSRNLNQEPNALFLLNDKGVLTPALRPGEDLSNTTVRGQLLDQARAGRLFLRGLDDDYPRQVLTDGEYNAGLTHPTNTLPAVEGRLPPKPQRPSFYLFKLVFSFLSDSFKEELESYNAKRERYDQSVQRREMIQNFGENVKKVMKESISREAGDPSIQTRKEAQAKALEEAWEQKKSQEASQKEAAEREWMNNPSKDTLPTFEAHLRDISIKDFSNAAMSALRTKGSASEYYKSLAQMMEQQFALPLLEKVDECTTEAAKNAILLQSQNDYIKMMKTVKAFVPTQINGERLQQYLQIENPTFEQTNTMHQEIHKLAANGMQAYQAFNPPKPEQPQIQQPQPQIQQQQQPMQPFPS